MAVGRQGRRPNGARRVFAAVAVVLAVALVGSACGGGGGGGQPDTVTVDWSEPENALIPGSTTEQNGGDALDQLFTGLVSYDVNTADPSNANAESITSTDNRTFTIRLKPGWTFHDGTPVTAQSYVDSWNTVAYGPNAMENSGQLANIVGYGDLNPAEGEPTTEEMSGLTVVDDTTFTVELSGADGQFPLQVSQAMTAFFPMPESALEDLDAYNTHPIGNGPFEIVDDYVENETIVVTAYDEFQGDEPTIDQISFVPYTDEVTAYTDVLAGNLDINGVPATRLTQAAGDFGDRLYSFEAPGISFLGLPLWDERYQDVRVRQAISMAIDRETIIDVVYGGTYEPATAWTPTIEPGTPEGICGEYCEYDPEAAAALLEEAGGFEGTMEIYFPGGGGLDALYEAIANQLRQNLGIDASIRPSADWAEFLATRTAGDIDSPYFSRWGALYPSQQATLRVFFIEGGGCDNCIPFYDADVAAAMATADADPSGDGTAYALELADDGHEVQRTPLVANQVPWVRQQLGL